MICFEKQVRIPLDVLMLNAHSSFGLRKEDCVIWGIREPRESKKRVQEWEERSPRENKRNRVNASIQEGRDGND
jgi:hypothetical protein